MIFVDEMKKANRQIYINARFLLVRPTGVERYAYEMCRALYAEGADIILLCPKNGEVNEAYDISGFRIVRFGLGHSHLWEQLILPFFFIGKRNYILLCFTGLGSILVPKKIMTIHDLSFLENPSWFSKTYFHYYKIMTPLAARTSEKIITVSKFSKSEIMRFYSFLSEEKIKVVYNAVDKEKFYPCKKEETSLSKPYFLAVSSLDPRKNFSRLTEAFAGLNNCQLKIVGGKNHVFGKEKSDSHYASNIEFLGRVTDEHLKCLYSNAIAFIFPSIYEGFGLPPIEAMASDTVVLVSDIPVLREICGNSAIFFNPNDISDIRNAINSALSLTAEERKEMLLRGKKNLERFSWKMSAEKLLDNL